MGYGNRAAEIAQQRAYEKAGVVGYGPIYQSHSVSGNKATVTFFAPGEGLVTKHSDEPQGFALAGDDTIWH
jgi:sialate O-acetylesterase